MDRGLLRAAPGWRSQFLESSLAADGVQKRVGNDRLDECPPVSGVGRVDGRLRSDGMGELRRYLNLLCSGFN